MIFQNLRSCLILLIPVCILFSLRSSAQMQGNQWLLGKNLWLDFNSGAPVQVMGSAMLQLEGCSNICDANGQLLFYTDGETAWDRQNNPMPNGTGMLGHQSTTMSAMILPMPGNCNQYYLFSVGAQAGLNLPSNPLFDGIAYSIVDMNLNGGYGDVTSVKNQVLLQPTPEKIEAVRRTDGQGYWVITHLWNSDSFFVYPVTVAGIGAPVISKTGTVHTEINPTFPIKNPETLGYMRANAQGNKLCVVISRNISKVELFDFDASTGVISNPQSEFIPFPQNYFTPMVYGCAFSPSGNVLYVTYRDIVDSNRLYQFDITQPLSLNACTVYKHKSSNYATFEGIQLAPDGKIYIATQTDKMGVINSPDNYGPSCNFQPLSFFTGNAHMSLIGVPNIPAALGPINTLTAILATDTSVCSGSSVGFSSSSNYVISSYHWDFGDPTSGTNADTGSTPAHLYSQPGVYHVKLIVFYHCLGSDTLYQTIQVSNGSVSLDLGPDKQIGCLANTTISLTAPLADSYLWSTGDTVQSLTVSMPGTYALTIGSGGCQVSDTVVVNLQSDLQLDLGPDRILNCTNRSVLLSVPSGYHHLWSTGDTAASLTITTPGTYSALISTGSCTASDTVSVSFVNDQELDLGPDIAIDCSSNTQVLEGPAGYNYLWSNGSTEQNLSVQGGGIYWLRIDRDGCIATDTVNVSFNAGSEVIYIPSGFTPNNDGRNDRFHITSTSIKNYNLSVYNRWGQLVFTSFNNRMEWDGTFQGVPAETGVYFYQFAGSCNSGKTFSLKGDVALIR